MPIGKVPRKITNEALATSASLDQSTIDSRMSSSEIPKMELLKVNYVHQCKEAIMQKPTAKNSSENSGGHLFPLQYQQPHPTGHRVYAQYNVNQTPSSDGPASGSPNTSNLGKVAIATRPLPPPPPTIESWHLMQNSRTLDSCSKSSIEGSTCSHQTNHIYDTCCQSDSSSDSEQTATDTSSCLSVNNCEKSNSWNYRGKFTTRDIRRDIVRAGLKSRAERIARIERTDCEHRHQLDMRFKNDQRLSLPSIMCNASAMTSTSTQSVESVRVSRVIPPHPNHPAPLPIPKKVPNARHLHQRRSYSPSLVDRRSCPPQASSDTNMTCCDCLHSGPGSVSGSASCSSSSSSASSCSTTSATSANQMYSRPEHFNRNSPDSRQQRQTHASRIPKPIVQDQHHSNNSNAISINRISANSAILYSEANEHLQRRIQQMFNGQLTQHYAELQFSAARSDEQNKSVVSKRHVDFTMNDAAADGAISINGLMRNGRQHLSAANYQKMKMERVHIRKKRQPLLIINQLKDQDNELSASKSTAASGSTEAASRLAAGNSVSKTDADNSVVNSSSNNAERRSCGYKNCTYLNCPMSEQQRELGIVHQHIGQSQCAKDECVDNDKLKRLSLESGSSDSGVSTSNETRELKENNRKNLLETAECVDCIKIFHQQTSSNGILCDNKDAPCAPATHSKFKCSSTEDSFDFDESKEYKLKDLENEEDIGNVSALSSCNGAQIKIHVGKLNEAKERTPYPPPDPNDVQNFAKKQVSKSTTTDELMNTTSSTAKSTGKARTKQCNIENELKKLNNANLRQSGNVGQSKTTIKIDDEWVHDAGESTANTDHMETDSLMPTPDLSRRKPINTNDNCVKIFVRSGTTETDFKLATRPSPNPQTPVFSSIVSSSSEKITTTTTAGVTAATTTTTIYSPHRSDGQETTQRPDCCCDGDLMAPINAGGLYLNQSAGTISSNSCIHVMSYDNESKGSSCSESRLACPPSPGSQNAPSELSCTSCAPKRPSRSKRSALIKKPSCNVSNSTHPLDCCDNAVGGVFWNNSYFCEQHRDNECNQQSVAHRIHNGADADNDHDQDDDNQCCCSLSSCDDDNCSFYENHDGRSAISTVSGISSSSSGIIIVDGKVKTDACRLRFSNEHSSHLQSGQFMSIRHSCAEDILIHNKKLLRKTDVIHELRPRSMDGVIDSGVSLNGDATTTASSSPDSAEHMQNQQDSEARRLKRGHVLSELLETERIYVTEMSSILKGYRDQMQSEEMMHLVPASLQGKEDILFGNLEELYTFHNDVFLKDLENCISTTELVALCFVQRRDTFYRLYSFYCQNIPRSERLRETLVDTHLFLQECQKRLGHKLPLGAYLLKPVQRITKYQLLLRDLIRFSDNGNCTKELQKALDCMLIVLKCVNDSMHQVAITGFPNDLSQQGELLLQDSFQVWTESKKDIRLRIKPQQRHIFLYQKSMLFCKQTSKPGHNKSTYQFKHYLKMSQIGLTESVRGDTKRFEIWLQGRQEVHTLQAATIEIKNKWVAEIKRVLLNQLEELKGEKIKQYGLNCRGLKQTTSWDTPNILLGASQRTISCDASSESSNRNSNCSSSGDDNCSMQGLSLVGSSSLAGVSTSQMSTAATTTSEKEQHDVCGWSSDYSNSEDEMSIIEENNTPGSKFIALADYVAMGHSEVTMHEGDTVELLKIGCAGWWFVRILDTNSEGWTPAAYLEPLNRRSSRSSSRNQERINLNKITE